VLVTGYFSSEPFKDTTASFETAWSRPKFSGAELAAKPPWTLQSESCLD